VILIAASWAARTGKGRSFIMFLQHDRRRGSGSLVVGEVFTENGNRGGRNVFISKCLCQGRSTLPVDRSLLLMMSLEMIKEKGAPRTCFGRNDNEIVIDNIKMMRGLGYLAKHSCIANIMRDHILDSLVVVAMAGLIHIMKLIGRTQIKYQFKKEMAHLSSIIDEFDKMAEERLLTEQDINTSFAEGRAKMALEEGTFTLDETHTNDISKVTIEENMFDFLHAGQIDFEDST
ncbi:hypothetical protein ACJX0J_027458, partial [Zea mays]